MRHTRATRTLALAIFLAGAGATAASVPSPSSASRTAPRPAPAPSKADAAQVFGHLPVRFEPNSGQTDPAVRFTARAGSSTLFLAQQEAVLAFPAPKNAKDLSSGPVVRIGFAGANPVAKIEPGPRLAGSTNYLIGSDPSRWRTGLPGYGEVTYRELYPGVDAVFHGGGDRLEYDFHVAAGTDPGVIALRFSGDGAPAIDKDSSLALTVAGTTVHQPAPILYQMIDGVRRDVTGGFVVSADGTVGFAPGAYDHTKPLVIDPTLAYSGLLGGTAGDEGDAIAVDSSGATYITGSTSSTDFPLVNAVDHHSHGPSGDAFVTKLSPDGKTLVYSTYLGGSNGAAGNGIAVDHTGSAFVVGRTAALGDFPTTPGVVNGNRQFIDGVTTNGSYTFTSASANFTAADVNRGIRGPNIPDGTFVGSVESSSSVTLSNPATADGSAVPFVLGGNAHGEGFVTKLSPSGTSLSYSTYLGGSGTNFGSDQPYGVAVASGKAYVTGAAFSADFPTTSGAFDGSRTFSDGATTNGSTTLTSASANFSSVDQYRAVVGPNIPSDTIILSVDSATSVTLSNSALADGTGLTFTLGGRLTGNTFLTELDGGATTYRYSTFVGPDSNGQAGVALSGGLPVVASTTNFGTFPVTAGAFQTTPGGSNDAFVTKVDPSVNGDRTGVVSPTNASLVFSTFLGGSSDESAAGIATDGAGAIYVTGQTTSPDYPATGSSFGPTCGDGSCFGNRPFAFVTKLAANGASIGYSGFLGGSGDPDYTSGQGNAIAVDSAGAAYVAGQTGSSDFPTVDPLLFYQGGGGDAFLTKVAPSGASLDYSTLLGGVGNDFAKGVAVDGASSAYVTGSTQSTDYPVTTGASHGSCAGCADLFQTDAFATKVGNGASPPAIKSYAPKGGPYSGGTTVVITGIQFTGATSVSFGGVPAASFTVDSDTQITAVTPPHPQGDVVLSVGGPNGTSMSSPTFRFGEGHFDATAACPDSNSSCGDRSVVLQNGKVLVAKMSGASSWANIYDPLTATWTPAAACTVCGQGVFNDAPPLVLLPNGKVLWAGGVGPGGPTQPTSKTAFLYDPAADTWSQTGDMVGPHLNAGIIVLPNGKALVAGGCTTQHHFCGPSGGDQPTVHSELYDPDTGTWSLTGDMSGGRALFPLVLIGAGTGQCGSNCGKVLAAGGVRSGAELAAAELYDPAGGTWSPVPDMNAPRFLQSGYQLRNGKVIEVGSYNSEVGSVTSESFDPVANAWQPPVNLAARSDIGHVSAKLANGKVLVLGGLSGGGNSGEAQLYDPATTSWTLTGPALINHNNGTAAALPIGPGSACGTNCGKVLLAGSNGFDGLTAELYTPKFTLHAPADFDADGRVDISVFRPSAGTWFVHPSTRSADTGSSWGASSDVPVPGDYDGDGHSDIAIYRPSTGLWAIHGSAGTNTFVTFGGLPGDVPVPVDYDGDGRTDLAIYRPSTGTWFVHRSSDNGDVAVTFGGVGGDLPIPADYDGDGKADVAIFRPSAGMWFVHPTAGGADTAAGWGASGDIPVPVDFDGDGKADMTIFRPSTGLWAVHRSAGTDTFVTYGGVGGDVPVAADFDGDGKADMAIFRPSSGAWFYNRSTDGTDAITTFGISSDIPLPIPPSIRRAFF